MTELQPARARRAIIDHTERLAAAAAAAGPDTMVPTAPEWTVAELVEHVGQTHHWVAEIIERRITDPMQLPSEYAAFPADAGEWTAWLRTAAQRAASACADDAIDAPVFNAAGDGRTGTQFWMASLVNESVVHGFDAANAAGRPLEVDVDIAAALITNHLAMLTSPTWAMQRPSSADAIRGTGQTLRWRATDADGTDPWFVERQPDGATWRHDDKVADVTVTGPAASLFMTLIRRAPFDDRDALGITVDGDIDLVTHWIAETAHVAD